MQRFLSIVILCFTLCVLYVFIYLGNSCGTWNASMFTLKGTEKIADNEPLKNIAIHIISVSDKRTLNLYHQHRETLACYAHRHSYDFALVDPNDYYTCSPMVDFFFKKHCAVMLYLVQNLSVQWLLVLDGDTFVVNATRSLESYIPKDPLIHVVHYERFLENEIAAGNYIIRNHPWSLRYLNKWVEFFTKLPKVAHHNHDNGVLHLHFLDMVGKLDHRTFKTCSTLYNKSHNENLYMIYVACTKCALKGQRKFRHVILHRRGHSFCRDFSPSANKIHPLDLMLHGYKGDLSHFLEKPVNSMTCYTNPSWTPKLHSSVTVSDLSAAKSMMKEWERSASKTFPQTVTFPEIAECWPDCDSEITGAMLDNYTIALCSREKFA